MGGVGVEGAGAALEEGRARVSSCASLSGDLVANSGELMVGDVYWRCSWCIVGVVNGAYGEDWANRRIEDDEALKQGNLEGQQCLNPAIPYRGLGLSQSRQASCVQVGTVGILECRCTRASPAVIAEVQSLGARHIFRGLRCPFNDQAAHSIEGQTPGPVWLVWRVTILPRCSIRQSSLSIDNCLGKVDRAWDRCFSPLKLCPFGSYRVVQCCGGACGAGGRENGHFISARVASRPLYA